MIGTNFSIRKCLALALVMGLIPLQLPAKSKKQQPVADIQSAGLRIFILEGKDAVNSIPAHRAETPVVEVRDDLGLPVENVSLEFRLPDTGPGGQFEEGKHVKTVLTNLAGQAEAPFTVNDQTGSFSIRVTAKIDTRLGTATIFQSNSMKSPEGTVRAKNHRWYKDWRVLTAIGAGTGALIAVLILTGGSSSPSTTVVLTPGGPTFGAPR